MKLADMLSTAVSIFRAKETPRKSENTGEIAVSDPRLALFGAKSITRYNESDLISRKGMSIIDEMRRDDQLKAAISFKKHAVLASGWEMVSPEEKDRKWEATELVDNALKSLQIPFDRSMLEIMTALEYGYSITEKIWEQRDNRLVLANLKTRRPHEFTFDQDPYGNITALRQEMRQLPPDKFLIYSYDSEFGNPYGRSDLEAAYRPWWSKKNAYQWLAVLIEKMGIPPIFFFYNSGTFGEQQKAELKKVLGNMQTATSGMIPRGSAEDIDVWSPELAGNVGTVFLPAIESYDRAMSRAVLIPGLLGLTADETQGSLARSQVHFDVFMLVVERIRKELADLVNKTIVRPMVDLNYGGTVYPVFRFLPLTDELRIEVVTAWADLVGAKVVTPQTDDEQHIRSLFKFPEANPEGARDPDDGNDGDNDGEDDIGGGKKKEKEDSRDNEGDEGKHPRHPRGNQDGGKFAPKGEEGKSFEKRVEVGAEEIEKLHNETGGSSYDMAEGRSYRIGDKLFMVSLYADREQIVDKVDRATIARYAERNRALLDSPNHVLGTWRDERTGKVFLDVSGAFRSEANARKAIDQLNRIAERNGTPKQIAYFDLEKGESVYVSESRENAQTDLSWLDDEDLLPPDWKAWFRAEVAKLDSKNHANREPDQYERKVDYVALSRNMDAAENALYQAATGALEKARDNLIGFVIEKGVNPQTLESVELKGMGEFQAMFSEGMRLAYEVGRASARSEYPRPYAEHLPNLAPLSAVQYMRNKALSVSGVLRESLLAGVRDALANSIQVSEPMADTMDKIASLFEPYIGIEIDQGVAKQNRLQTIVRTNVTDALNRGRLAEIRDPDMLLLTQAVRYSALLDERTTEICQFLEGKFFDPNDSALDALIPPNHFNCRSIVVPVIIGEQFDRSQLISAADVQRAKGMIPIRFGGMKPNEWNEAEHPRHPRGTDKGGEFAPKDQGGENKIPQAVHDAAVRWVTDENDKNIEHCFVYGKYGEILLIKHGNDHSIKLDPDEIALVKGAVFVHNHPLGSSLSIGDFVTAEVNGMREIVAVSSLDKTEFVGRPTGRAPKTYREYDPYDLGVTNILGQHVEGTAMRLQDKPGVTPNQAQIAHYHIINTALHMEGKVDYSVRNQGPVFSSSVEAVEQATGLTVEQMAQKTIAFANM